MKLEKALDEIDGLIACIEPKTDEMRTIVFYLNVVKNYLTILDEDERSDYIEGQIDAYLNVLKLFDCHQNYDTIPSCIRELVDKLKGG